MPKVELAEGEYEIHFSIKVGQDVLTAIEIPILWERFKINSCYVKRNNEERLFTQDEHGNPDKMSCFCIKK